jgi:hypothetical protein
MGISAMKIQMKYLLLILIGIRTTGATSVDVGATREDVVLRLGEPLGHMQHGERETLLYPAGTIILERGFVISDGVTSDLQQPNSATITVAGPGGSKRDFERSYGTSITPRLTPGTMTGIPVKDLPGVDTATYRINDRWIVSVIFLDGRAAVLSYSAFNENRVVRRILKDEFEALLENHAAGMAWRQQRPTDATQVFFGAVVNPHGIHIREDGVSAFTHGLQARIETQAFREAVTQAERRREEQRIHHIPGR